MAKIPPTTLILIAFVLLVYLALAVHRQFTGRRAAPAGAWLLRGRARIPRILAVQVVLACGAVLSQAWDWPSVVVWIFGTLFTASAFVIGALFIDLLLRGSSEWGSGSSREG